MLVGFLGGVKGADASVLALADGCIGGAGLLGTGGESPPMAPWGMALRVIASHKDWRCSLILLITNPFVVCAELYCPGGLRFQFLADAAGHGPTVNNAQNQHSFANNSLYKGK
jgi:hypothetical protein